MTGTYVLSCYHPNCLGKWVLLPGFYSQGRKAREVLAQGHIISSNRQSQVV